MRTTRCLLQILAVLCLGLTGARAGTNDTAEVDVRAAQKSIEQLQALVEKVTELEQSITSDPGRRACIVDKLNKLKGLLEVTRSAAARLPELLDAEDPATLGAEQSKITIAVERAQKLAADAEACSSSVPVAPKKRRLSSSMRPAPAVRPPLIERDEDNCLKQGRFAELLIRAMELGSDLQKTDQVPTDALAKLAIEPLGGWHADDCTSLDDLCVTIARALNLRVESPNNPVSYMEALRVEGFPLEMFFPQRPQQGAAPLLLESEVRAFLSKGYAAPLPSSKRLMPD